MGEILSGPNVGGQGHIKGLINGKCVGHVAVWAQDRSSDTQGIAPNEGIGVGAWNGGEITRRIASEMRRVVDYDQD